MRRILLTVLISVLSLTFFGINQAQALDEITQTRITKTVFKIDNYVRVADNVVILFDSSSSMNKAFGSSGITRLQVAKELLKQRVENFPDLFPELNIGLYSYTPKGGLPNKASVKGYEVFYPMQPFNKTEFLKAVDQLPAEASGATLIGNALRRLDALLDKLTGRTVVFIFTDGSSSKDALGAKPLEMAQKLAGKYDVNFQLISTAEDSAHRKMIEAVASINEASRVHSFANLINRPEVYSGSVFAIEEAYLIAAEAKQEVVGFKLDHILFGFDKSDIELEFTDELAAVGEALKENPESYIVLAGHTDSQGEEEYNLMLSHQRVEAVGAHLAKEFQIDASRILMFWYGEAAPVASNDTLEGRKQNRRVIGFISGVK
ncbi:MAG: OmpA family protein [Desulfuromonadales bacterium]|nr:OmpA family protein [Desulfuromonadales bacterium]